MANPHSAHTHDTGEVHHETSDVDIRRIFGFGVALVIAAIVIHFGIWLLFKDFDRQEAARGEAMYPLAASEGARLPPEPRLQTNPRQDMQELRASEDALLESYGWVDKNAGIVRIPIDQAMKLTVQRGLPARQATGDKGK